jgi:hypothetical protein
MGSRSLVTAHSGKLNVYAYQDGQGWALDGSLSDTNRVRDHQLTIFDDSPTQTTIVSAPAKGTTTYGSYTGEMG